MTILRYHNLLLNPKRYCGGILFVLGDGIIQIADKLDFDKSNDKNIFFKKKSERGILIR